MLGSMQLLVPTVVYHNRVGGCVARMPSCIVLKVTVYIVHYFLHIKISELAILSRRCQEKNQSGCKKTTAARHHRASLHNLIAYSAESHVPCHALIFMPVVVHLLASLRQRNYISCRDKTCTHSQCNM